MDNLGILIQAILSLKDTEASKKQIIKELPVLERSLQSDEKARVKIIAGLNTTESKKVIQSQLDTLVNQAKAPTIKINVDTSNIKKAVKDTSAQISNSNKTNQLQIFDSKKLDAEGRKYFYKTTDIINRVKNYYLQNGALKVDISSLETAKGQIQSFTATVEDSTGVIKKFNFERAKINTAKNYGFVQTNSLTSVDKNAGTNLKSTLNFLSRIDEKIMSIQSKTTKQSNPLKEGTEYYNNYINKLTEVRTKIDEITSANKVLSAEQKNQINKMIAELSLYAKEQQKLAYPPMISSTSIEDSVKRAQATLTTLEQKWKAQGILTGEFKAQVVSLRTELDQVGNTEGLNKYNTSLKLVQESAKQLLATQRQNIQAEQEISSAIATLNSLQNSSVFTKNAANPQVIQTKQEIAQLITEYQLLKTQMQGDISPAGLDSIRVKLDELNTRFAQATSTAQTFESQLKNSNGTSQLANKVALLTARIEAFRKANTKSEVRYGSQYNSILSELRNPNIDVNTYNGLVKQFQKLQQEIKATNDAGKTLWGTFKEKLTKFASWMSMTYAFSLFMRTIRSMITGVIDLDTAIVDLRKTFKGTETDLKNFYNSATQTAKEVGVSSKEIIEQAAAWSRLGSGVIPRPLI